MRRLLLFLFVATALIPSGAGAPAAGTAQALLPKHPSQDPIDRDKDGVADSSDACASQPAGRYDSNRNGCPGPYKWIPLFISYGQGSYIEGGITYLKSLSLTGLPAGTKVTIRGKGVYLGPENYQVAVLIHRLTAKQDGAVTSEAIKSVGFKGASRISIRAALPGWIGFLAELKTFGRQSPRLVKKLCIPAEGVQNPVACGRVERGR